jgi:hypothetical protein
VNGTVDRISTSSNVSPTCAGPLFGGDTDFAVFDLVARDETGEGLCIGNGTQLFRADVRQSGDATGSVAITGSPRIEGLVVIGAPGPLVRITTSTGSEQPALLGASIGATVDDGIIVDLHAGSMATIDNAAIAVVGGAAINSIGAVAPTVTYSNVSSVSTGGYAGMADPTGTNGNLDVAPLVVSAGRFSVLEWDLHLQTGSPLRDAGDPSIDDPDATVSDIGAYCGLNADFAYYDDTDGDGMFDGYERFRGLAVGVDDAGLDADGDNLTNLDEFLLGTLPFEADTDADGTNDDVDATPL